VGESIPSLSLPPRQIAEWSASRDTLDGLDDASFCRAILPHVSRTFALSVPYLPPPLDLHVGVGYLLCRIADTIEDEPYWSGSRRQAAFSLLLMAFARPDLSEAARPIEEWAGADGAPTTALMRRATSVFRVLESFPPPTMACVAECVTEMITGMRRMPGAGPSASPTRLFRTIDELEVYCHYVAGVVGIMLTRLFDGFLGPEVAFASPARIEQGRRFGLGLQLTNILADRVADTQHGRLYLPDLGPTSDATPTVLARALDHLAEALIYSLAVPPEQEGIRCFCLLPLFFALRTLGRVADWREGNRTGRPKISRQEVSDIVAAVTAHVRDDSFLRRLFSRECAARSESPARNT